MAYCKNCGVELEDGMQSCPLCGDAVNGNDIPVRDVPAVKAAEGAQEAPYGIQQMSGRRKKRFAWEVTSIVLFSGVLATLIINLCINKHITWSEYPVAACLTAFAYVSFFAFFRRSILVRMSAGFIVSSLFLWMMDSVTGGQTWAAGLGIPILLSANLVILALLAASRLSVYKGFDLIGTSLVGAGLLCMCIDGILSFYTTGRLHLRWSLLVAASVLPVATVLFFLHFRLKKGRNLKRDFKKTFHV